uniref:Odorant receptor n=1 Tax=Bradysia odoriphaga TaxID=1564500 RepID=A0A6B9C927_9DIPT|nr:odorant receptor 67 [Bradysia odoriphaga]
MTRMTNQIWATWKSKLRTALNRHGQFQVISVKPVNSSTNTGDKNCIEAKHLQKFRAIWSLVDSMAFVVGVSLIRQKNINARMVLAALLLFVTYPFLFYTKLVVWPNVPFLLEVLCIYGALIPSTLKFTLIVRHVKQLTPMHDFFEKILISHTTGSRSDDLVKEMNNAYNTVKFFVVVSVPCFAVFVLYPVQAFVTEGRLIPIMRIEFPFVDQTDMKGYLIGLAYVSLIGFLAVLGNVAFDVTVLTFLLEFKSLVTLLEHDLHEYYEFSKEKETYSTQYRDSFLKNICKKYNDIHRFLLCFQRTFGNVTYHSICALYGSLICSVYATLNNGWIPGYGFCLFCFIQLYFQCILGTFVDNQQDRMSQAFYLTPWYEYPIRVQKIFLLLIHASSFNAVKLRIGPFALLDVQTGVTVTKLRWTKSSILKLNL